MRRFLQLCMAALSFVFAGDIAAQSLGFYCDESPIINREHELEQTRGSCRWLPSEVANMISIYGYLLQKYSACDTYIRVAGEGCGEPQYDSVYYDWTVYEDPSRGWQTQLSYIKFNEDEFRLTASTATIDLTLSPCDTTTARRSTTIDGPKITYIQDVVHQGLQVWCPHPCGGRNETFMWWKATNEEDLPDWLQLDRPAGKFGTVLTCHAENTSLAPGHYEAEIEVSWDPCNTGLHSMRNCMGKTTVTVVLDVITGGVNEPAATCGNVNGDDKVDLSDAVYVLNWLFVGGAGPICEVEQTCADTNSDDKVDVSDAVTLLNWMFLGGPAPACPTSPGDIEGFTFIGDNAQGYPEYTHDQTGIVFVSLPGGTFNMGSPEDEPFRYYPGGDFEGPVHAVTLSPFLIAKYELTQAQWEQVMGENPSYFDGTSDWDGNPVNPPVSRDTLPVEEVSWDDIQEFETRTGLTLPTEAQWEYACRGGTETAFSFGAGESCEDWMCAACPERDRYMWYCGNAEHRTHTVGKKKANPFGLHDMHGNVSEWCEDLYNGDFYSLAGAAGPDPVCSADSVGRVNRGGTWYDAAGYCRSAYRGEYPPDKRIFDLGLRPARSLK